MANVLAEVLVARHLLSSWSAMQVHGRISKSPGGLLGGNLCSETKHSVIALLHVGDTKVGMKLIEASCNGLK